MRSKTLAAAVGLTLGVTALAACGSDGEASGDSVDEVIIGGTYPLSGALADDGQEMVNAIQQAVDDVNADGGIESLDGAKVVFKFRDSTGAPEQAANNVQTLIDDGASAIIGAWLSSNTLATTQVAERAGVPHIVDQSQAPELIERGYKTTFRVMFDPPRVAKAANDFVELVNEQVGGNGKAVHLHEDSAFGSAQAEYFAKEAGTRGNIEVEDISYAASTTDMSAEVAQAIASGADLLLSTGYGPDSGLLLRTLKEQGADFKAIIGVDSAGWYNNRFAEDAGDLVENVFDAGSYPVDFGSEDYQAFVEAYQKEYGGEPSGGGVMSYVSARVLMEAIEDAGSADPDDIREALASGSFDGYLLTEEEITFDEVGQNEGIEPITYQFQNGRREVVFPEEWATSEPVWP
jgi:branched-chain amino acid transport system substrate-binding protein